MKIYKWSLNSAGELQLQTTMRWPSYFLTGPKQHTDSAAKEAGNGSPHILLVRTHNKTSISDFGTSSKVPTGFHRVPDTKI